MVILDKIKIKNEKKKPLAGYRIGFCLHITKETSVLVMTAKELGADVALCSANPLSVQDDIAAFLSSEGITIFAWRGETKREYEECINSVLKFRPNIITDDGSDLHIAANKTKVKIFGGSEETTSGVKRLKALERRKRLKYPVIAVNDAYTKHMFDNRYGTGQSTIDGILRTTSLFLPGKQIIVCGYGWVGKGVAARARGMGAIITITEIDPIKAIEANMDGFNVKRLSDVVSIGDIFITCTGQTHVIREEHIKKMKSGAILANAGHFDIEIDTKYLYSQDKSPASVRVDIDCFNIVGKKIYLISKGRVVNLVGAEGHPPEVMALSFANQLLSIIFISKNYHKMENKIYNVPREIDQSVAKYALDSMNIEIDKMTKTQRLYIDKWE
ncbi:MAG: S-adenosyl-L-homocysteine hydrolase [Nitrososphaeraceae archaeon]|jgi:adenosylhomocysteinase|nr:S-adenosyl-L-homocysteine hydrolase [Nitrososphaeraceae archaeon]MCD6036884.1 S-adenosyl-L-homocysteine hydrolase [Nitrososphaeraceae archaeon]MDF2768215.1 S-adenosyl-L-homocysteine hydrolase [Nitrososphaeraceae archaeon]